MVRLLDMAAKARSRLWLVGRYETIINGQTVSYLVKRSNRAKYLRLEVRQSAGLVAVLPRRCRIEQLDDFLRLEGRWILNKLARLKQETSVQPKLGLFASGTVPYLGKSLVITCDNSNGGAGEVKVEDGVLLISARADCAVGPLLESWYREQATGYIGRRIDVLKARLGVSFAGLAIRGQKTRWGSCSARKNLSFNWKLMFAPEPVIDYVLIHELTHLKEMNHSKKFWKLVSENCPDWKEHRKWLREHEVYLSPGNFICP